MMEFFQAQMDYIYFFYGLAFILLGVVSFLIKQRNKLGPDWFLLGLFGIFHGLNEWAEMIKIIFGDIGIWLTILRLFLMTVSFLFLFEFARNNNNRIGKWVYFLITIILSVAWYFFGVNGFELFVRYILGVAGAFGAGFVFWRYGFSLEKKFTSFRFVAIAFWFYALSLLVNSSGHILGITFTKQTIFFQTFGIPIQLIRGVLMTMVFVAIWVNYQMLVYKELSSQQAAKKDKINRYLFTSFIIFFIFGWLFTDGLGSFIKNQITKERHNLSQILTTNIERILQSGEDLSFILSGSPNVIRFLKTPTLEAEAAANLVVDRYKTTTDIDIAYILDKDGTAVVTSNRNDPDSLLGKSYNFRSYYKDAINGKPSEMFALGVTTNKPGYYASHPIKDEYGVILGVAVVKSNLNFLQKNLNNYNQIFLVSPEGVVLLSNNSKFISKSFFPISLDDRRRILKSKLYGENDFVPILDKKLSDDQIFNIEGKSFLLNIFPVNGVGWNVYITTSVTEIAYYRLFAIVLSAFFYFIIISFLIIFQFARRDTALSYFASILSSASEAVIGKDLSGKIISWNKSSEILYGYDKEEVVGKNISILIPLDVYKKDKTIEDLVISGESVDHYESIRKKKNGELIYVDLALSAIIDMNGVVVGISTISRDITREKKAEENLKKHMIELEKFKLASDSSSDTTLIVDKDGYILYHNKATELMTGYSEQEINKSYVGKLLGLNSEKSLYQKMWHTIKEEKKPFIGELKNLRKNGEEYFVLARFYPLIDKEGSANFFVGVETDISKAKEMERIKSEFVSVASHQLRTPLTGIKWFTELLLKGKAGILSEEQTDYVQQVFDSNDRMIRLVDDLLDVSHIDEAGKFQIILSKEDFSKVIKEVVREQKNQAKEKGIKIVVGAECLKKTPVNIDRLKLEQAMLNILNNAIKYSPNGSTILVNCVKEKGWYVCSFKDRGIGIPLHQQHRVFEKFFRADNVITVGSGTGLGLYIARHIIERHGGKMWFESKVNKGTTVYFSLPIK